MNTESQDTPTQPKSGAREVNESCLYYGTRKLLSRAERDDVLIFASTVSIEEEAAIAVYILNHLRERIGQTTLDIPEGSLQNTIDAVSVISDSPF